jgi:hypothetical protein
MGVRQLRGALDEMRILAVVAHAGSCVRLFAFKLTTTSNRASSRRRPGSTIGRTLASLPWMAAFAAMTHFISAVSVCKMESGKGGRLNSRPRRAMKTLEGTP